MKKYCLLFACAIIGLTANAQKTYVFKTKLLPAHIYQSTLNARLLDLAPKTAPPFSDETSVLKINAGDIQPDKSLPVIFMEQITGLKYKGQNTFFMPGVLNKQNINAHANYKGEITIDAVPRLIDTDAGENIALNMINQYKQGLYFPDKALKIGDTFTNDVKINPPFSGWDIDVKISYKLIAIKTNQAIFTTALSTSFDNRGLENSDMLSGSAKGTGTMVFDLALNYPVSISNNLDLDYTKAFPDKQGKPEMKHQKQKWVTTITTGVKTR
jgi:hypothetical protein